MQDENDQVLVEEEEEEEDYDEFADGEYVGQAGLLDMHMRCNMFPPIDSAAREIICEQFRRYWKEQCSREKLLRRINWHLKRCENTKISGLRSFPDHFYEWMLNSCNESLDDAKPKPKWSFPKRKVARIRKNVRQVINRCDMELLSKESYDFLMMHCGFIAHYNHLGFVDHYRGKMSEFVRMLSGKSLPYSGAAQEASRHRGDAKRAREDGNEEYAIYLEREAELLDALSRAAGGPAKGGTYW